MKNYNISIYCYEKIQGIVRFYLKSSKDVHYSSETEESSTWINNELTIISKLV